LECVPDSVSIGEIVLGNYCGWIVLFEPDRDRWREVDPPAQEFQEQVTAGDLALIFSHDLRSDEVRTFAFRPRSGRGAMP
jgi:hypothetical protein